MADITAEIEAKKAYRNAAEILRLGSGGVKVRGDRVSVSLMRFEHGGRTSLARFF
jgi:hypothetical protein